MTRRSRVLVAALAVFALAIGILIGSGPLRALIGAGSGSGDELAKARAEATAAKSEASQGRDFADAAGPSAVSGLLEGHTVALVRTPDASDADLATATARLVDAGAQIGAKVALTKDWTADDRGPFREALAEQIVDGLSGVPENASTDAVLSLALAQSLAPTMAAGENSSDAADAAADTLWTLLSDAKLVTGDRTADSDLFVLVTKEGDVTNLATAFGQTAAGTVVAFTSDRAGDAATASTVTNAATFYGAWAVTGAMINAANGDAGAYDATDADELIAGLAT